MFRSATILICILGLLVGKPVLSQDINQNLINKSISLKTGNILPVSMDTTITGGQFYHPLYENFPSWSEMGNIGQPGIPNKYSGLISPTTPSPFNSYAFLLENQNQITFFNAKSPYSKIRYNSEGIGDNGGQNLEFLYTRNFKKEINIVGSLDFISSNGDYKNQAVTFSTVGVGLTIEKTRYNHYSSFKRNMFKLEENGGIVNDEDAIDNDFPGQIPVNLPDANSKTSIMRLKGRQTYNVFAPKQASTNDTINEPNESKTGKLLLIHNYNFSSAKRLFKHNLNSIDSNIEPFFSDVYIDSLSTQDSLHHYSLVNDVKARIRTELFDSANWFIEGGFHHELLNFYSFENSVSEQRMGLGFSTEYDGRKFFVNLQGLIYLAGYGSGNYNLGFNAGLVRSGSHIGPVIKLSSKSSSPELFVQNFSSNHFRWTNDFLPQKEQRIGISWSITDWKLKLEMNSYLISNWIYFDKDALPAQKESEDFLASASVSKLFQAGPLRSNNTVFLNYSEAEEIPLPTVAATSSTFMHHDIHFPRTNGVLHLEYGMDIRYTSSYQGYAYMPATGVFYLQNERLLGNYPFLGLFVMIQVKHTRFFVKWDHVNSGFTGDNIFPVLHYPHRQRYVKYGFSWYFYD